MSGSSFDWRWIAAIVFVAILVAGRNLPWPVVTLTLAAGGGYMLYLGWQVWKREGGSSGGSSRVTYWRGQRIELKPEKRSSGTPSLRSVGPALLYLIVGGVFVLSAVLILFQQV
jgi:hypothetical protein